MSVLRAKNKVPLRKKTKHISYPAEAMLFFKLIIRPQIAKVTKKDWCAIRELDLKQFTQALKELTHEGTKNQVVREKINRDIKKVQKINKGLDQNIIKKQDVEEYLEDKKKDIVVPKKRPKKDKIAPENGTNEPEKKDKEESFGETTKCPENVPFLEVIPDEPEEEINNDSEKIHLKEVLYSDVSTRGNPNFDIHVSRWKVLQACAYALEDLAFRLTYQAGMCKKPGEMKQVASAISDIQKSFREIVPDYFASKERMGTIMVLEALKTGQIDIVEAAISFDIVGVPMPDSVKMLMQKYIEPEKEEDKPMITHEEIEQRRLEVLENIRNQIDAQPTKAREVEELKAGLRGQLSYDIEAAIEKED